MPTRSGDGRAQLSVICVCFASAALVIAGCGSSTAGSVSQVTTRYLSDLQAGDASDACALETPHTARLQEHVRLLLRRYYQAAASACGLEALAPPADFSSTSTVPAVTKTVIHSHNATVTFRANTVPIQLGNPLHLVDIDGHWRVDATKGLGSLSTAQEVEQFEGRLLPPSCLSGWNEAVAGGAVTVTGLTGTSGQSWAQLVGNGGTIPCTIMTIDEPDVGYCETYIENQGDGTWLQEPCVNAPMAEQLQRDVWLTSDGTAVPASQRSPDGAVPALEDLQGPPSTSPSGVAQASPSSSNGENNAAGAAPTLQVGPATDRVSCTRQVATQGGDGNCSVAEAAFAALKKAYRQEHQIPSHISVTTGPSRQMTNLSCDLRNGGQEVDCLEQQLIIATFFTSDIER